MNTACERSSPRIQVLLADDHDVVRLGLRTLLNTAPDIDIVGEARNGEEAVALTGALRPDVVVMDVSMAVMDGVAATRELARRQVPSRVLILTMHDEEAYLVPLLEAGALGYVVKDAASAVLLNAVRTVAQGHRFVRPQASTVLADEVARRAMAREQQQRHDALSERERAVFLLIAQGYASSQIGERLHISAKTVDTYRRRVNDKLGIGERADYVRLALDLGLLSLPPVGR